MQRNVPSKPCNRCLCPAILDFSGIVTAQQDKGLGLPDRAGSLQGLVLPVLTLAITTTRLNSEDCVPMNRVPTHKAGSGRKDIEQTSKNRTTKVSGLKASHC